jgi:hypothetical protein
VLQVRFVPGRTDSNVADQDDLLPAFTDDFFHTLFYFLSNGEHVRSHHYNHHAHLRFQRVHAFAVRA